MQTLSVIIDKNVDNNDVDSNVDSNRRQKYRQIPVVIVNEEIIMQTKIQTPVVDQNVDIIGNSRQKCRH